MFPQIRARLATTLFILAGVSSFFAGEIWQPHIEAPLAVFYVLLVVNTFFSIRFFSHLFGFDVKQEIIDAVLFGLYLLLAYSMRDTAAFFFSALLLFVVAILKYVLLLEHGIHLDILRRKIRINILGACACCAALYGIFLGHPLESAWVIALVFGVANVYLLAIRPMYRL